MFHWICFLISQPASQTERHPSKILMKAMEIKLYYILALVVLVINLSSYGICQTDEDLGKAASFIFGDSLVDAGNNNYLQTLSKANIPPNGIDFKASGGNPTGRFTNGRTIGDIVGKILLVISRYEFLLYFQRFGVIKGFDLSRRRGIGTTSLCDAIS